MTSPATPEMKAEARSLYLTSLENGDPLTGKQLAEMYGRSDRWGRLEIAAAREGAGLPAEKPKRKPRKRSGKASVPATAERPERRNTAARGKYTAGLAFVVGIAVSVAGNVASTAAHGIGAALFGAFWPLALLLAVEVIVRVHWAPGLWHALARYVGTGAVAAVAAVMSYRHLYALLLKLGEDQFSAAIGPLAVDGLLVVAAAAMLSLSQRR